MTRVIRAQLNRFVRRRTIIAALVGAIAFALVATLSVFSSPLVAGAAARRGGATLAALTGAGGGTEAFAVAASFAGFLVFVTVIALVGSEFSGGTFRALLLREPHRLRVIVGLLAGILIVAAGIVALCEVATFGIGLVMAPAKDISTSEWFSLASLREAGRDYLTVLAGVTGWAIFGTTLAVIFRSVPLALAVGFAWAGPFENIVVDSWNTGYRVFPGQVLGSLIRGGTTDLAMGRAVATALVYTGIAAVACLALVVRRDVTS
jgi:ABC-2 type transport system permease protein